MKTKGVETSKAIKAWKIETFQMISGFSSTLFSTAVFIHRKEKGGVLQKGVFLIYGVVTKINCGCEQQQLLT